jgi:NAD-dependent deacetylase
MNNNPEFFSNLDRLATKAAARNEDLDAAIDEVVAILQQPGLNVAFTGAGISTESGIPDFRSPGGTWTKLNPSDFDIRVLRRNPAARSRLWERFRNGVFQVEPNDGHRALAALERAGLLSTIITQNVDGLHQAAGSSDVIELHGNGSMFRCMDCRARFETPTVRGWIDAGQLEPNCPQCGGFIKTDTIAFGEQLPEGVMDRGLALARACNAMLVVGSTVAVYPAATIAEQAVSAGAAVVIINISETELDPVATVRMWGKAGPILSEIARRATRTAA